MGRKRKLSATERREMQTEKKLREERIREALEHHGREDRRSFVRWVEAFYAGRGMGRVRRNEKLRLLFDLFGRFSVRKHEPERRFLRDILLHLDKQNCRRLLEDRRYLTALANVAGRRLRFIRDPLDWRRNSYNPAAQFSSLSRFCFAEYDVPRFMDECWFADQKDDQRGWFIGIGQGESPRKLRGLPIEMSARMVRYFLAAPDDYTIDQGLRRAQVLGMGGDSALARAIVTSLIGRNNFENETFWQSVIRFFVRQSASVDQLHGIVDYLAAMVRENPAYSVKGRTIPALIRRSDEWHANMARLIGRGGRLVWKSSGIGEYSLTEGKEEKRKTYRFHELLSSRELNAEGRRMQHCVYSYAPACNAGRTTIFSLRETDEVDRQSTTLATIEVFLGAGGKPTVVQAKAKQNRGISDKARALLHDWARREGLTVRV